MDKIYIIMRELPGDPAIIEAVYSDESKANKEVSRLKLLTRQIIWKYDYHIEIYQIADRLNTTTK